MHHHLFSYAALTCSMAFASFSKLSRDVFGMSLSFLDKGDISKVVLCSRNTIEKVRNSGKQLSLNGKEYPFLMFGSSIIPNYLAEYRAYATYQKMVNNLSILGVPLINGCFEAKNVTIVPQQTSLLQSETYDLAYAVDHNGSRFIPQPYGVGVHVGDEGNLFQMHVGTLLVVKEKNDNMFVMFVDILNNLWCNSYLVKDDTLHVMKVKTAYEHSNAFMLLDLAEECESKEDFEKLMTTAQKVQKCHYRIYTGKIELHKKK